MNVNGDDNWLWSVCWGKIKAGDRGVRSISVMLWRGRGEAAVEEREETHAREAVPIGGKEVAGYITNQWESTEIEFLRGGVVVGRRSPLKGKSPGVKVRPDGGLGATFGEGGKEGGSIGRYESRHFRESGEKKMKK